jgi:hypothetical protein
MLLVVVVVVATAGFAVTGCAVYSAITPPRRRPVSSPMTSKRSTRSNVVLEVFGAPGAVATINYLDVNAAPQRVDDAALPWSYDITTTQPAVFTNVVAQGNSDSIGCRIIIDGAVKDERSVNTMNAYTFCMDKSG